MRSIFYRPVILDLPWNPCNDVAVILDLIQNLVIMNQLLAARHPRLDLGSMCTIFLLLLHRSASLRISLKFARSFAITGPASWSAPEIFYDYIKQFRVLPRQLSPVRRDSSRAVRLRGLRGRS